MDKNLKKLKKILYEVDDISNAASVLGWDQSTYMPVKGALARARQGATLGKIAHQKLTAKKVGKLLKKLKPLEKDLDYGSNEASLIRVARRDYEKATKIPADFLAKFSEHVSETYQLWVKARAEDKFEIVKDNLEKTLDYSRKMANYFDYKHIADPLIDNSDRGMTVDVLRPLFSDLRKQLVPLVNTVCEQKPADDSVIKQAFDEEKQLAFSLRVAQDYGYDLERGRLDKTHHPFMTSFSIDDVRITTRVNPNDLSDALFSTLHETGHALYELGISHDLERTPLAGGTSSGVHESQSRLWENQIGRSKAIWHHYYPQLQEVFPKQLKDYSVEQFYKAINKVSRSLIRTDADELTYNLHVIIRFDLETDLLEGKLAVKDLPEVWRERYKSDIGVFSETDANGVLQDVHWYGGQIGGVFQGYTLGNIMSSQFYRAAVKAHPEINNEITNGKFATLHTWLKDNIYRHGSKFSPAEIVKMATGEEMNTKPYIAYLKEKYGELYNIKF